MTSSLFNELVKNNLLIIRDEGAQITKQSQKKGSPLDRYRAEILFFRYEMHCSYNDIAMWLSVYKDIQRSHTSIANKIRQWEKDHAP
ncbi:hypothetical protein C4G53_RS22105 [Vibrio parahaemolyticus]|nr:hypothetical protein [Vibrio parahaemolyticus]HBC3519757.1 hypothetical protein [Vibrio parahaemolyticus]